MALAGPGSSFGQEGWARGPYRKVGVQGPNGSGGPVPYISPPLIRAQSSRTNQGIQEAITIQEAQRVDIGRLRNPLMRLQKARCIWLLVQPSSLFDGSWTKAARVWQLRWGFVGFPASQLLNAIYSSFGPYKWLSLSLSFTFAFLILQTFTLPSIHSLCVHLLAQNIRLP